jgi:hypothetical protein
MSIVLCDTSLWISAIQFRGLPLQALRHALSRETPLTCIELENEIVRILGWKFGVAFAALRWPQVTAVSWRVYLTHRLNKNFGADL